MATYHHFSIRLHGVRAEVIKHCGNYLPLSLSLSLSLWLYSLLDILGLIRQEISPSQGRYLHTEEYKHRISAHRRPGL
jgi:hypothetical protein